MPSFEKFRRTTFTPEVDIRKTFSSEHFLLGTIVCRVAVHFQQHDVFRSGYAGYSIKSNQFYSLVKYSFNFEKDWMISISKQQYLQEGKDSLGFHIYKVELVFESVISILLFQKEKKEFCF